MRTRTLLSFVVLLYIACFQVPNVDAAVGVKAGDWAKYSVEVMIDMPGENGDSEFQTLENVEWIKVAVETVSGNNITGTFVLQYKNGTEETDDFNSEIGTSDIPFFVEPNQGAGDSVPVLIWSDSMPINGTEERTYAAVTRDVNYVRLASSEFNITSTLEAYWDKATGTLCELSMSLSGEVLGESLSISMLFLLTETNIWEASGFLGVEWPIWGLLIGGLSISVIGVVLLRRRTSL